MKHQHRSAPLKGSRTATKRRAASNRNHTPLTPTILRRQRRSSGDVVTKTLSPLSPLPSLLPPLLLLITLAPTTAFAQHPIEAYLEAATKDAILVEQAQLEIEAAQATVDELEASFWPIPTAEVSLSRLEKEQVIAIDASEIGLPIEIPEMLLANQNVFIAKLGVVVPIYVGGQRFTGLKAAKHGVLAREHALEATENGIRFGAVATYILMLQAQQRVEVLQERLEADQTLLEAAQAKVDAEIAAPFDALLAETIVADDQRRVLEAQSALKEQRYNFNDLVGADLEAHIQLEEIGPDPDFSAKSAADGDQVAQKPALLAMDQVLEAQKALREVAERANYPGLYLLGEGGYKDGDLGYTEGDIFWMVTLAMRWNLSLDQTTNAKIETATIEEKRQELAREIAEREVELEVTQALRQYQDMLEIIEVAKKAVNTAQDGHHNATLAYQADVLPLDTVAEASKELANAKDHYVQAYYGLVLTELQLRYHAGLPLLSSKNLNAQFSYEP